MKNTKFVTKFIAIFLLVVMTMSSNALADQFIVTSKNGVNVRDELGEIVGVLSYGEIVEVYKAKSKYMYQIVWHGGMYYATNEGMRLATEEEVAKSKERPVVNNSRAGLLGNAIHTVKVQNLAQDEYLGEIQEGEVVYVVQTGRFEYKIVFNNSRMGYVPADAVEITGANLPKDGILYRVKRSDDYINARLRSEPNKDSRLVEYLEFGDYVKVVEIVDDKWAKVIYNSDGDTAYLALLYIVNAEEDFAHHD